jgi:REP element-mobilizing transposase RayT
MTRSEREDTPGAWHHVMNRGIAKRTLFESEVDIRTFLSRLACAARAGRVEVHAFCILTTHFHLLLRSPQGRLSEALHHVQNSYSRWFNRSRKRDGPLYRARFRSKRVDSLAYRFQLVRYIDSNPVSAGLVEDPQLYPHGSAARYREEHGPPWLQRGWVQSVVTQVCRTPQYRPTDYLRVFGEPPPQGARRLVERRIEMQGPASDALDDLIGAAPPRVLEWMRRKALLADGTDVGLPVCDAPDVSAVVIESRGGNGEHGGEARRAAEEDWDALEVGLLRDLCGVTLAEAAQRTGSSVSGASRRESRHRRALLENDTYATRAGELASRALELSHRLRRDVLEKMRESGVR